MRSNPILSAKNPLRKNAVLRSEIKLLCCGDGYVVQTVQESEGMQWRVCFGDGG